MRAVVDGVLDVTETRACYDQGIELDPEQIAPARPRRLRRVEYDQMVELGIFEEERVELLRGVVVEMTPTSPPHDATIQRLTRLFVLAVGDRAGVRVQGSWAANDDSEPVPDVVLVPPGDYDDAHPSVALLVVEVAYSSLRKDRAVKAALYAECGVPEYWIVNLVDGVIEVMTTAVDGEYTAQRAYRKGERIRLSRLSDIEVAVDDVLR